MTIYEEWDLAELEQTVADAKEAYIKARDAHQPCTLLWNEYTYLLHTLRLHKRREHDAE